MSESKINFSGLEPQREMTTIPWFPKIASIWNPNQNLKKIGNQRMFRTLTSSSSHNPGVAKDSNKSAPHNNFI